MANELTSLFERLNAPFPYSEYKYDSFGDRCYVSGQSITERLNEVFGVGYWRYEGLHGTEKIVQEPNGKNPRVKMYVQFSFYNVELQEWISFIDAGSEQVKPGMNEGDATKSAITDGMKKCASRIGVGSDLYKGMITWDKKNQAIIVPNHYQQYYHDKGWQSPKLDIAPPLLSTSNRTTKKSDLTDKLKNKASNIQNQIKVAWQELAGSLDGLDEWYTKKLEERVTDQQIMNLLQKKLQEKQSAVSA